MRNWKFLSTIKIFTRIVIYPDEWFFSTQFAHIPKFQMNFFGIKNDHEISKFRFGRNLNLLLNFVLYGGSVKIWFYNSKTYFSGLKNRCSACGLENPRTYKVWLFWKLYMLQLVHRLIFLFICSCLCPFWDFYVLYDLYNYT